MNIIRLSAFIPGFMALVMASFPEHPIPPLVPKPRTAEWKEGVFHISRNTTMIVRDSYQASDVEVFNDLLQKTFGLRLKTGRGTSDGRNVIVLVTNDEGMKGTHTMDISRETIRITGDRSGILYGLMSLLQLVSGSGGSMEIPCGVIDDGPRYPWRGMHLDVGRHFFPKEFIKRYIDYLALYKMNTFHWHLTEDQGWRIEIKKYPKLAEVGAWRNGSMVGHYNDQRFDSVRYGGFYTQDEIREVVAYASQRHVTIIPEIEMPGHSTAALAAYPELSCTGGPFEVGKAWGVYEDIYCSKDKTFEFLEDVLTEVCDLFPGTYIHIGGDEAPKTRWQNCEQCQAVIKREGLKDEHELQSYFISRIEKFLQLKGKRIVGWDEILEGGLAPNAAVMSWRGTEGGIAAARQQHQAVMTPWSHCYFDYYQGDPPFEPLAIGGFAPIETVYSYEPTPDELTPEEQGYILGAQGNVWTEYITTTKKVEYMALPRMAALAEVVWTPKKARDYPEFRERLVRHFPLLDRLGVNYSKSIFGPHVSIKPSDQRKGVIVELSTDFGSGAVHYTLDGSEPAPSSSRYESPIEIAGTLVLKAAYFSRGTAGRTVSQPFVISRSTGKKVTLSIPPNENYAGDGAFTLVDGIRGEPAWLGQRWLGWQGAPLEVVLDLGKPQQVSRLAVGILEVEARWIHHPKGIDVFLSVDGSTYELVAHLTGADIRKMGKTAEIPLGEKISRFVRIRLENKGKIPDGKPGAGNDAWLFIDEILIN